MFNMLTAKIMSGVSVALLLAMLGLWLWEEGKINNLDSQLTTANKTIASQNVDLITLRGNQRGLEQGLAACNSSVDAYADVVDKLSAAGVAALNEVKSGNAALANKLKRIDGMSANSCEDAAKILKEL